MSLHAPTENPKALEDLEKLLISVGDGIPLATDLSVEYREGYNVLSEKLEDLPACLPSSDCLLGLSFLLTFSEAFSSFLAECVEDNKVNMLKYLILPKMIFLSD